MILDNSTIDNRFGSIYWLAHSIRRHEFRSSEARLFFSLSDHRSSEESNKNASIRTTQRLIEINGWKYKASPFRLIVFIHLRRFHSLVFDDDRVTNPIFLLVPPHFSGDCHLLIHSCSTRLLSSTIVNTTDDNANKFYVNWTRQSYVSILLIDRFVLLKWTTDHFRTKRSICTLRSIWWWHDQRERSWFRDEFYWIWTNASAIRTND